MIALGLDTSNYTTSIAWFDGRSGENQSRLLPVRPGELGLRQSDAVFAHVQGLPALAARLFAGVDTGGLEAIGVSTRPRAVEGSYMPCFQVGLSQARTLAAALGVPVVEVAHQQGHLAAALWAAGKMDLLDGPFLAWHLSGGTTELLYVEPEGWNLNCRRIGGTMDISAGQLIDRTGKLLGLPFPAGRHLDELSQATGTEEAFRVKCPETWFSPVRRRESGAGLPPCHPESGKKRQPMPCARSAWRCRRRQNMPWSGILGYRWCFLAGYLPTAFCAGRWTVLYSVHRPIPPTMPWARQFWPGAAEEVSHGTKDLFCLPGDRLYSNPDGQGRYTFPPVHSGRD